jgi:hypothetical protein
MTWPVHPGAETAVLERRLTSRRCKTPYGSPSSIHRSIHLIPLVSRVPRRSRPPAQPHRPIPPPAAAPRAGKRRRLSLGVADSDGSSRFAMQDPRRQHGLHNPLPAPPETNLFARLQCIKSLRWTRTRGRPNPGGPGIRRGATMSDVSEPGLSRGRLALW